MGNSTLPTVLDKLCMVANINTRKLIEIIKAEIKLKYTKIEELERMIDFLRQKIDASEWLLTSNTITHFHYLRDFQ